MLSLYFLQKKKKFKILSAAGALGILGLKQLKCSMKRDTSASKLALILTESFLEQ